LRADLLLLLTAAIWGFAFVAQRVGMDYVGPFTYNAVRFAIGSLSLVPLILLTRQKKIEQHPEMSRGNGRAILVGGLIAGLALFIGASLQQAGLVYTTAGKAGFITGLYVVMVPLLGLFWKQRPKLGTWAGAILAAVGLYFLSVTEEFTISFGDLLVLLSACFWAGHVLIIGWLSPKMDSLKLASVQFAICSLLSFGVALGIETIALET
ncbi:MAG: DMT family transporter, partial [bacterium]|nr:DMT family transporter [bacterium]